MTGDDDARSHEQYTTNGGQKQQQSVRERLKQAWNEAPPFPIASRSSYNWKVAVAAACECKTQLEAAL